MQKKDALGVAAPKSLTDSFRCGECLHFEAHKHPSREQVCSKEGVKAAALAPSCFTPDVTRLAGNSDLLLQFFALFQAYEPKERRVILGLLRSRKKQHVLGTKLYFCIGSDYISNYLSGFVAGYTSSGQLMIIGSPDNKTRGTSLHMYMPPDSVAAGSLLTHSQWKIKRDQLRTDGLIFDPANRVIKKASITDQYEPVTLDSVPAWFYEKGEAPAPKRKKTDEISFNVG
jgi:hypothetical protein